MTSDLHLDLGYLDRIEDAELRLLCWGVVDAGWEEQELLDQIDELRFEKFARNDARSAEDVLDDMVESGLIMRLTVGERVVLRSRMAETVRLLVRLRQLFPNHLKAEGGWDTAPRLVSDFRFAARPRARPRKDRSTASVLEAIVGEQRFHEKELPPLRALLEPGGGGDWRWSGFQERSFREILQGVRRADDSATLVAAGTGAGKTLAFYVPALATLARLRSEISQPFTKLLGVYPRNELLKDQLRSLLVQCRDFERTAGVRLSVGAFYGATPTDEKWLDAWPRHDAGRRCPYLDCLECSGPLVIRSSGRRKVGLVCADCGDVIGSDELVLSRNACAANPPDVLLTTTEMLNRQLSADRYRAVFGIGLPAARRPRLLLLDEVHTYSGTSGASAGLTLRRWRHAVGSPVHVVGLSATIVDGGTFLARLASVDPGSVAVVEPLEDELEHRGKEYLIALRGDPASGTALLSTTIQTAMLLRRSLTPGHRVPDSFGKKLFAFTDDLDVTNRLLHFLREAEGLRDNGEFDGTRPCGSLATLRSSSGPDHRRRLIDGQSWDLAEQLGFRLEPGDRMRISRTSSQDAGYDLSADIVVATASLEVGLDDPEVGAVLQHKAPRDDASFLQRRGRAGRSIDMRPWTGVVLSDFGRDRQSFHRWDRLFDPVLDMTTLPMSNRFLLKIHATYSLLEFVGEQLRRQGLKVWVLWTDLCAASDDGRRRDVQIAAAKILERLLDDPQMQESFRRHVGAALQVDSGELDVLLWGPPRSVLGVVVPTMIRRLRSQWSTASAGPRTDRMGTPKDTPLPDFLPSALFADLLLPEVEIQPPPFGDRTPEPEFMGVLQALREFSPGRVTHRFAVGHRAGRLWLGPDAGAYEISGSVDTDAVGNLELFDGERTVNWAVRRPSRVRPTAPSRQVADSSYTAPRWASAVHARSKPMTLLTPDDVMCDVISELRFHVHRHGAGLVVTRATSGSDGTIVQNGNTSTVSVDYTNHGGSCALGFQLAVDGVGFEIVVPADLLATVVADPDVRRSLRRDWFFTRMETDPSLGDVNVFSRRWLADLLLAGLVLRAERDESTLSEALGGLNAASLARLVEKALDVVFQSTRAGGPEGDAEAAASPARRQQDLVALASDPGVADACLKIAECLADTESDAFEQWLQRRYASTVASAVCHAVGSLHPDINVDDLVLDVFHQRDGAARVWITETKPGGVGALELVVETYRRDPQAFWRLVRGLLHTSDDARIDHALRRVIGELRSGGDLEDAASGFRSSSRLDDRQSHWSVFVSTCVSLSIESNASIWNAIAGRLLRPGSSAAGDEAIARLLEEWDGVEERLDIEVDVRTFSYLKSSDESFDDIHGRLDTDDGRRVRFNSMLSVLWPRASEGRRRSLGLYQPYHPLPMPDIGLAKDLATGTTRPVALEHGVEAVRDALRDEGAATLVVDDLASSQEVRARLLQLLVEPTELGVLEFHPSVVGVTAPRPGSNELTLELGDAWA